MKIFVIDDDPVQLEMARAALEVNGYKDISVAEDPVAALDGILSASERYDVFLLDILMPKMDGIELCRRLRQSVQGGGATIIMTTALSDRSHIDGAFTAGADDYVLKPFDPSEISHRLRFVERRASEVWSAVPTAGGLFIGEDRDFAKHCGLTHHSAMEAYVRALDRGRASLSMATSFWVLGWDDMRKGMTSDEEDALVRSCSENLKASLKTTTFVLSYYGNGVFVCVTRRADPAVSTSLSRRLSAAIQELCGSSIRSARAEADLSSPDPLDMINRAVNIARNGEERAAMRMEPAALPDLFSY